MDSPTWSHSSTARRFEHGTQMELPQFLPLTALSVGRRWAAGGVCSFEVTLDEIAGLDYWNPLLVDASRVVELRTENCKLHTSPSKAGMVASWLVAALDKQRVDRRSPADPKETMGFSMLNCTTDLLAATTRGGQLRSSQRLGRDRGTRAARSMSGLRGTGTIHGKGGFRMAKP
eukprot:Skav206319  [mRNA]  locus=scaffold1420:42719:47696:+ [translate_table: standard]